MNFDVRFKILEYKFGILLACLIFLMPQPASAQCRKCKRIRKADVVGIKSTRQYLRRREDFINLRTRRNATRQGYSAYSGCVSSVAEQRRRRCLRPVLGIPDTLEFLCANQLRSFRTIAQAERKGFSAFENCASPAPDATPLPKTEDFELEAGVRLNDKTLDSIIRLTDDSYRGYFVQTDSEIPTTATSSDGLTWSSPVPVQGINIDQLREEIVGVSVYQDTDGTFQMFYELNVEVASTGTTINRVHYAFSNDGITFTQPSSFTIFSDVSAIANTFYPEAHLLDSGSVRLYYLRTGELKTATTADKENWTVEGAINMRGFSNWIMGADVVQLEDGRFRMYFSGTLEDSGNDFKIFSALSENGRFFTLESGPVIEPEAGTIHLNPEAVQLPNGDVRLYITERSGAFPNQTFRIVSALEVS